MTVSIGRSMHWRAGIVIFTLIGSLVAGAIPASPARAQTVATAVPALTVYGSGKASAPAATATVQLLIGQGDSQFGFEGDASGGGGWESADSYDTISPPESAVVTAGATPEGRVEGRRRNRRSEPQSMTSKQLAPIVDALVASAGLAPEAVQINFSPLATEPYGRPAKKARLDFDVAQPTPEGLTALITAASAAAASNGLVIETAGVRYNPADCATIEDEAAAAAVADAAARAERLARLLGVTIGGVVAASSDFYGSLDLELEEDGGCGGQIGYSYDSRDGGIGRSLPVFDPAQPAEITVVSAMTVAYEIVANDAE